MADYFRCKLWLGGTRPDRYFPGIGNKGLVDIMRIDREILPAGVEVQTEKHIQNCHAYTSFIWIGARNSQNYALLESLKYYDKPVMIKRGVGMTIDEVIGLYDIMKDIHHKDVYIIERGIADIDRKDDSRWSPDLKGVIRIKHERPDIFRKLVIDCSHSVGRKEYIGDVYSAFLNIDCNHFMFECTSSGKSRTDQNHMLSVRELKDILGGWMCP